MIMSNNLLAERKRLNLSREAVATYVGKSVGLVGAWERGERSPKLLTDGIKLAQLYNCSLDYLAGLQVERK